MSITFYASGRLFRTDWFRFHIEVKRGEILRLAPVNVAARRVKVLDATGKSRELVKDVVVATSEKV